MAWEGKIVVSNILEQVPADGRFVSTFSKSFAVPYSGIPVSLVGVD
jgi:hypothetical protein